MDTSTDLLKSVLSRQYEATLCTLGICVDRCPPELWQAKVARYPFSQVVFHTLIGADLNIGTADEQEFRRQAFHLENPEFFGDYEQLEDREPVCIYEKPPIKKYLAFVRDKAVKTMAKETAESLAAPCQFSYRKLSRAELQVYSIRHIQHHSAQLTLRLRLDAGVDVPWVGAGWKEL